MPDTVGFIVVAGYLPTAGRAARRGGSMAEGDGTRRLSLPWFLPVICFIPLLIAAPLWHRAPAAEPAMPDVEHLTTDGYLKGPSKPGLSTLGPSKPVVEQPAPRPVRRQQLHTSSPATRKHNTTRHTRDAVSG